MNQSKNICFLLGVMPRTGTNYIANIIECHDSCISVGPLWEDFFISNSNHLENFSKQCLRYWNPSWDKESRLLNNKSLMRALGNGLLSFINQQRRDETHVDKLIIAKTPTVRNIDNFFQLFPNNKLIIVVRDGRNIIASGERSFRWDFDKSARDWSKSINNIMSFIKNNHQKNNQILLLKYEDIYTNSDKKIKEILQFLSLDEAHFNWEKAKSLGISGSSETVDKFGKVSWATKVEKTDDFKPLERYEKWSNLKKMRFSWLAGNASRDLGYNLPTESHSFINRIIQISFDIIWPIKVLPKTLYYIIKEKRFILKSH